MTLSHLKNCLDVVPGKIVEMTTRVIDFQINYITSKYLNENRLSRIQKQLLINHRGKKKKNFEIQNKRAVRGWIAFPKFVKDFLITV